MRRPRTEPFHFLVKYVEDAGTAIGSGASFAVHILPRFDKEDVCAVLDKRNPLGS